MQQKSSRPKRDLESAKRARAGRDARTATRKKAAQGTVLAARLTEREARSLTDAVKRDAEQLWAKLVRLYEGEAHTARGYSSWADYFKAEFGGSDATAYRWLQAGRVMQQLPAGSPRPNEAQLRELTRLVENPTALRAAWREVVDRHPKPTAPQVRDVVRARMGKTAGARRSSGGRAGADDTLNGTVLKEAAQKVRDEKGLPEKLGDYLRELHAAGDPPQTIGRKVWDGYRVRLTTADVMALTIASEVIEAVADLVSGVGPEKALAHIRASLSV
jgi:hypothetical protein